MSKATRSEITNLLNTVEVAYLKYTGKQLEDTTDRVGIRTFRDKLRSGEGSPSPELRAMGQVCKHYADEAEAIRGDHREREVRIIEIGFEMSVALHALNFVTAWNVSKAIKVGRREMLELKPDVDKLAAILRAPIKTSVIKEQAAVHGNHIREDRRKAEEGLHNAGVRFVQEAAAH